MCGQDSCDSVGAHSSVGHGAICTRLRAVQRCLSELSTGSSAELGVPGHLFFRSVLGFKNHFLLRARDPTLSALGSRHQHLQRPCAVGPCSQIGQPRGEEAESTFLGDFLSATGQSSQETREVVHGG